MPGGYDGYRAAPVRRQLTPGRISSLPVTGGLPLSISFSTSCPELNSDALGTRPRAVRRQSEVIENGFTGLPSTW